MELEVNEQSESRKKRKIRIIAGLFFGMLLLFTFFSNTLLSLTLPKVQTSQASAGSLNHSIEGSGTLIPLQSVELNDQSGWKVKSILVKNGDSVVKGQALITFDSKTTELQIANEQTSLKQQKLQLDGLFDSYIDASKNGDPLMIKAAKRAVDIQKLEIEAHERNIQASQTELQNNRQILAPFAGVVTQINATEGVPAPQINVSNTSKGFSLTIQLAADNVSLLSLGEKLEVAVKMGQELKLLDGAITEIEDNQAADEPVALTDESTKAPSKKVKIRLQDAGLKGGEIGSIKLQRAIPTEKETVLVSRSAIHEDQSGKYVYVLEERKGTLGNGFYVHKSYIKTADSTESVSAVVEGIFQMDEIIMESSEPLQDGQRVRI
ncbi:biotin/lipoyl-binding protein [Paenibacillus psychroresistens]|uniref:Biotin/lipoyl-binding protein n=1 Tax=Paenibacillus psychroresistens TaxID=1778678 RepID=A0A6B8RFI1_9BACL|nr:biotin/lipoyl-binding protein [Paenibacillus psychroresistens]QGQ94697.1 biotin/lipoyl-binding protein [Paenibacillus psychroresistens]